MYYNSRYAASASYLSRKKRVYVYILIDEFEERRLRSKKKRMKTPFSMYGIHGFPS